MTEEWDYEAEPVVGYHISAHIEEKSSLKKTLEDVADDLGIESQENPMVHIEIGDVGWHETKNVSIPLETLVEMALKLDVEYRIDD